MNTRLQQQQSAQSNSLQQSSLQKQGSFENAEEVIRADREQTQPPDSLGERLAESIAREPQPPTVPNRSWWQRLFGS